MERDIQCGVNEAEENAEVCVFPGRGLLEWKSPREQSSTAVTASSAYVTDFIYIFKQIMLQFYRIVVKHL